MINPINWSTQNYTRYLLFIAGLGGLLYGIDIGIIAGALPYLESTASIAWSLSAQQLSFIVAAVLLGSVLSSLFAGSLSDWLGRKRVMLISALLFSVSIPMIALSESYYALLLGRLLQGISAGLIGVAVPLYLAESLRADIRGRGTGIFQLMLTIGLVFAAFVGLYHAHQVDGVTQNTQHLSAEQLSQAVFAAKDQAWRQIFWASLLPGIIFCLGIYFLHESPRWLFKQGNVGKAHNALLASRSRDEAATELDEMRTQSESQSDKRGAGSLLTRRYMLPFFIACVILACNQATGINSILAYVVNILNSAGLPGAFANLGDVTIKVVNALMTIVGVLLVDRKGRKFLLMLGSGGIILSLLIAGLLFLQVETQQQDRRNDIITRIEQNSLQLRFDAELRQALALEPNKHWQMTIAYSYGEFSNVQTRRSDDAQASPIIISRENSVIADSVIGQFFRRLHLNPFADPASSANAPLQIQRVLISEVPSAMHGWLVAIALASFVAFFAIGPGVCVWLALSELMPTRIRSVGMSIALLVNQLVSTTIAALFLPTVGQHGYAAMFFFWSACTVIYFLTAAFLLPETKGKTLEEIEQCFSK